jgi:nitrogen regulatory protein PII
VRGFSSDRTPKSGPPIVQDLVDYTPYVRVEVFCGDDQAYEIKYTIEKAARTGNNGDGKIYVADVSEAIRIQTAERESIAV